MPAVAPRIRYTADPVTDLITNGHHEIEGGLDPRAAADLDRKIRAIRRFDAGLFLTEAEFDADPQHIGVNPRPGRNLLERFERERAFVEADPAITGPLEALLGQGYQIVNEKVICGVPTPHMPDWVLRRIRGNPVNNLGAYVRPEFRDITYFYGIDFHQDLIDYPEREADFVTLYVYLHEVGLRDAPLSVLEGSHRLGGSLFPHDLTPAEPGWRFRARPGAEVDTLQRLLVGPAGYAALWHACTLHGTQPGDGAHARLSLRYLIAKRPASPPSGIDAVNATLAGPLSLGATRRDLDPKGAAKLKINRINQRTLSA